MRAIVIERFGGPEVLCLSEVPDPKPGRAEVRIRVEAVSVNSGIDGRVRAGDSQFRVNLPVTPGVDPVGTIDSVGEDVDIDLLGRRVVVNSFFTDCGRCDMCLHADRTPCATPTRIGVDRPGGYAEAVVVPATAVTRVPEGLDPVTACVVARHFPTAMAMVRRARVSASDCVLIMGAAGGLGSALVQLAAETGATVIAAAGTSERVRAAIALGAHHGIDYGTESLSDRAAVLTDRRGVNVVFENIGNPVLFPEAVRALAFGGRLWTVGAHGGDTVPLDVRRLYMRSLSIHGGLGPGEPDDLRQALEGAADGRYHALIDVVLPLSAAEEAHRRVERRQGFGKVVLTPDSEPVRGRAATTSG